jgi:putative sterol carrier protein
MKGAVTKKTVQQTFISNLNVEELLTEIIPKRVRKYIQKQETQEELKGTELKLTFDISGSVYSYIIKNGVNFNVKEGNIESPNVRISFSRESMAKIAGMNNIDTLTCVEKQLSRKNFDLLYELTGTSVFQIKHPDESISEITATFNNAEKPKTVICLSIQDAELISSGRESIFNLLVSGKIKIDGYITFAMKLQPLFVS